MKVLHVYRTYFPDSHGGLEEVIRQICLNTRDEGAESRVFSLTDEVGAPPVDLEEARVIRAHKAFEVASNSVTFSGIGEFRRQVAWADIVHYHFPWPWGDVLHALAGFPKNALVTYHSDIVRQKVLAGLYRPLMNQFLGSMARIVATSPNYMATSDVLKKFDDKTAVVPIGICRDSYPSVDKEDEVFKRCEAKYGRDFFLFVGVLRYYKGLHILLNAVANSPYQVVICGAGPIEKELREQARELGLTNVQFAGYVNDVEKMALFELSQAVVFPSYLRSEAFGVTLLEGAMCGRPLISAEVGSGTSHINVDGQTGIVVTPGCARSLRQAIQRLHEQPELARQLGENARNRYERLFTGAVMGRRYAKIYRDLLEGCNLRAEVACEGAD